MVMLQIEYTFTHRIHVCRPWYEIYLPTSTMNTIQIVGKLYHTWILWDIEDLFQGEIDPPPTISSHEVIANMTVGKDVSALFADVVNCIQTGNVELKKLVYLQLGQNKPTRFQQLKPGFNNVLVQQPKRLLGQEVLVKRFVLIHYNISCWVKR